MKAEIDQAKEVLSYCIEPIETELCTLKRKTV